jgi:cation:H+ antiporter
MLVYILMIIGFAGVIGGAHFLVDGAKSLARKLKVSDLVVGLTVVAFGTSLPELSVNIVSSIQGSSGITLGNIVGSNIANILLILGVSGVIFPLAVTKGTVWKEIPLSLLAALLLGILANDKLIDGVGLSAITRIDGLVLIAFFIVFIYYTFGIAHGITGLQEHLSAGEHGVPGSLFFIVLGLSFLIIGSRWIVTGAVALAGSLGVGETVIGLTIVAVGTSVPELATSAVAAYKKNPEIAVGNIVGSNIFNIFFILGISSIIRPITFEAKVNIDIIVLVVANLLLFFSMFTGKKKVLDRWECVLFLIIYAVYIFFVVV